MRIPFLILTLLVASLAPVASSAQAATDDIKGFWQKGDVVNWRASVKENTSAAVVYHDYPLAIDRAKELDKQEQEALAQRIQAAKNPQKNPQNTAQNQQFAQQAPQQGAAQPEQPMTREQIIAKYGSPEQVSQIRAQKDAPPEMQGLFAALNSGDKELAWQYSVALARRSTEMQNMVSKAADYQLLAMESLGMRATEVVDEESESQNPNRLELRDLMQRTREQELRRKLEIDRMMQEQGLDVEAGLARVQAEAAQAQQIPVDPEGKVKVLIFLDEKDGSLKELSKSLEPLKATLKSDPNVAIIGLTKRSYALPAMKKVAAASNFPFSLLNGEALAQELRIQSYPTFLFLAVSTKQTYRLEGARTADEVGKVIRLMKGQR